MSRISEKSYGESLMESLIPRSITIEQNILESDSVQELFTKIVNNEISFNDLLELINNNSTKILRDKIIGLFLLLDSQNKISINEYLEKSKDVNRNIRQIVVLCILEKIKFLSDKKNEDFIELFNIIYPERLMDVDSLIRLFCLETYGFLCLKDDKFFKKYYTFLKYALYDKNESVRKCSLKIIIENFNYKKTSKNIFMKLYMPINEMLEFDKSKVVKNLCAKIVFMFYKAEFIGDSEVLKALNINLYLKTYKNFLIGFFNDNSIDGFLNEINLQNENIIKEFTEEDFQNYQKHPLLEDSLYTPLTLHFIADKLKNQTIHLSTTELKLFLEFLYWKESQNFKCCELETCYLEVLKIIKIQDGLIPDLCKIQKSIKRNKNKLKIFSEVLEKIDLNILINNPNETEEMIKILGEEKIECFEFFKSLKIDFKTAIENILINYPMKKKIKYFDFSGELKESDDVLTKCYAVFWFLINQNFSEINNISLGTLKVTEIPEFLEFLEFFEKKSFEFSINYVIEEANDLISGIKIFYEKLKQLLENNMTIFFLKETTANLLIDYFNRKGINSIKTQNLFFIESSKNFQVLLNLKPKQLIFDILFEALKNHETQNLDFVLEKLKILIPKIKRGSIKLFLYFNEFCLIEKFENILIELIPLLKYEDAIVLENKTMGKLKEVLLCKIKSEEN